MNTIRLKPKYEKIRKELIRNNTPTLSKKDPFIEINAQMIAQGLQLAEECSEDKNN